VELHHHHHQIHAKAFNILLSEVKSFKIVAELRNATCQVEVFGKSTTVEKQENLKVDSWEKMIYSKM